MRRVGQITELRPECLVEYRRLHDDDFAGVRDLLSGYGVRNFSIFIQEVDGRILEFGYFEYIGDDYARDMQRLAAEPRYRTWLERTDAMQVAMGPDSTWQEMERVFFHE